MHTAFICHFYQACTGNLQTTVHGNSFSTTSQIPVGLFTGCTIFHSEMVIFILKYLEFKYKSLNTLMLTLVIGFHDAWLLFGIDFSFLSSSIVHMSIHPSELQLESCV